VRTSRSCTDSFRVLTALQNSPIGNSAHRTARTNARHSGKPTSREETTRNPSTLLPHVRPVLAHPIVR